jgi:voltage-gated sodium channel
MVASVWYNITLIIFIIIAGMLAGFGMYPKYDYLSSLVVAEFVVQVVFSIDCFVKILHEGRRPYLYWCGPSMGWNNFDFCLTIVCWISDLSIGASNIGFLRLIRVMRLVRLVKIVARIRQLKVIVTGLVRGLSSVKYILLLLFLCFYCYAVAGVLFFRKNDPFHFGGIGIAMVYLFRCSTLDSWSTLFYINAFGCDSEYESISSVIPRRFDIHHIDFIMTNSGKFPLLMCWEPLRSPLVATIYFSTFILLAGFVILSLFIGAVNNGMTEAISEFNARYTDRDARIQEAKEQAQLDPK